MNFRDRDNDQRWFGVFCLLASAIRLVRLIQPTLKFLVAILACGFTAGIAFMICLEPMMLLVYHPQLLNVHQTLLFDFLIFIKLSLQAAFLILAVCAAFIFCGYTPTELYKPLIVWNPINIYLRILPRFLVLCYKSLRTIFKR